MIRFDALVRRLVFFSGIGAVTGALYVVLVGVLVDLAHLGPKIASVLAYLAALPVSFIANRQFTFRSTGQITHELPRFVLVHCANMGAAVAAMSWASVSGLSHWIGGLLALPLVPLSTFALMEIWVFTTRGGSAFNSKDTPKC